MTMIEKEIEAGRITYRLPNILGDYNYFDSFIEYLCENFDGQILEKRAVADIYDYKLEISGEIIQTGIGDVFNKFLKNLSKEDGGILNSIVPKLNEILIAQNAKE